MLDIVPHLQAHDVSAWSTCIDASVDKHVHSSTSTEAFWFLCCKIPDEPFTCGFTNESFLSLGVAKH